MKAHGPAVFCPNGHRIVFSTGECNSVIETRRGVYHQVVGPCEQVLDQEDAAEVLLRPPGGLLFGLIVGLGIELIALLVGAEAWSLRAALGRLWRF